MSIYLIIAIIIILVVILFFLLKKKKSKGEVPTGTIEESTSEETEEKPEM